MTIENQVTSLELSKRLKALNVKQESLWTWEIINGIGTRQDLILSKEKKEEYQYSDFGKSYYSAFTVAELGERLPKGSVVKSKYGNKTLKFITTEWDKTNGWQCSLRNSYPSLGVIFCKSGKTEANARAKMLIYLIENNLLEK